MPYIKNEDRIVLEDDLKNLLTDMRELGDNLTAGTLNYLFTRISLEYMKIKGLRYQNGNDVMGALEGAKLEFYRRVLSSYEDLSIAKNGDVDEFKELDINLYKEFLIFGVNKPAVVTAKVQIPEGYYG